MADLALTVWPEALVRWLNILSHCDDEGMDQVDNPRIQVERYKGRDLRRGNKGVAPFLSSSPCSSLSIFIPGPPAAYRPLLLALNSLSPKLLLLPQDPCALMQWSRDGSER